MIARTLPLTVLAAACMLQAAPPAHAQTHCQTAWTGYTSAQGAGIGDRIYALEVFENKLVARGTFLLMGGASAPYAAIWDGQSWIAMPGSAALNSAGGTPWTTQHSLAQANRRLYAANELGVAGGPPAFVWDGSTWSAVPSTGLSAGAWTNAMTGSRSTLFASGGFTFPLPGSPIFRHTAAYNGTTWFPIGDGSGPAGPDVTITSMATDGGPLYVAGRFDTIYQGEFPNGPVTANNIAVLAGTTWSPLGSGFNGRVNDIAIYKGELYAIGEFTALGDGTPMAGFARWDGAAWHQVGGGLAAYPSRLFVADDGRGPALFLAGGNGTVYNTDNSPVAFNKIARWDGERWHAMGVGVCCSGHEIFCGANFDPGDGLALYIGGNFTTVNNQFNSASGRFARWGLPPMTDTDGDGIFDLWETEGIDADCDGVIDLVLNADPNYKDLFIEVDAMAGFAPSPAALQQVEDAFAAAPNALVNNPDGFDGINLHIDLDETDLPNYVFPTGMRGFQVVKADHFGAPAQRSDPNWENIREAKRRVYRYCIFGIGHSGGSSSGLAELPGNDFLVSLGLWSTPGGTEVQQAGTFMHELGHTLGLYHGGHQIHPGQDLRYNYKPNYRSVMNYNFQFPQDATDATWALDYSRLAHPHLDEASLHETVPIGAGAPWHTIVGPLPGLGVLATIPCDFDRDAAIDASPVAADLNRILSTHPATPGDILEGSEDWSRLRYNFRNTVGYADGANAPDTQDAEMDHDTYEALNAIPPGGPAPCPVDWNEDDAVNSGDISAFLTDWIASVQAPNLVADFNADGTTNSGDISAFLTAWIEAVTGGC